MGILLVLAGTLVLAAIAAKSRANRKAVRILLVLAMACLIISSVILFYSGRPVSNYRTPPYFSEDAFRKIHPGMTAEEVRNLVGQPLERWEVSSIDPKTSLESKREKWLYSKPERRHEPYRLLAVVFEKEDEIVVETTDRELRPWGFGPRAILD